MKWMSVVLIAGALANAGDGTEKKKKAASKQSSATPGGPAPAARQTGPDPTEPPAGSEKVGDYLYRYKDPQGKVWMYQKGPFGLSKWEDKPFADKPLPQVIETPYTVTEMGDKLRFTMQSAVGLQTWDRKKTELNDKEKEWWQETQAKSGTNASSKKTEKQ